jgi:ribonuclease P protein component
MASVAVWPPKLDDVLLTAAAPRAAHAFPRKLSFPMPNPAGKPASSHKPNRLLDRSDFLRVAASGKKYITPSFILQKADGAQDQSRVRYGLTATKKIGNAVTRNRARRRLRALAEQKLLKLAPPGDYVLIAREAALTRDFATMGAELEKAFTHLKASTP